MSTEKEQKKAKQKIQEIIEKSGNDLHFQVAEVLRSNGWTVAVSRYYNDPSTGKPREIDLVATKKYPVSSFLSGMKDVVTARLYIESKYIKDPIVLWNTQKNLEKAVDLALSSRVFSSRDRAYFAAHGVAGIPRHHYVAPQAVAKVAAKAGQHDVLYEGMNGCLNGMLAFREQHEDGYNTVDFPIIAVNPAPPIFVREQAHPDGYVTAGSSPQLEVDYPVGKGNEYFLIDIVSVDNLPSFLDLIEKNDIALAKQVLSDALRERSYQARTSQYGGHESLDPFE